MPEQTFVGKKEEPQRWGSKNQIRFLWSKTLIGHRNTAETHLIKGAVAPVILRARAVAHQ